MGESILYSCDVPQGWTIINFGNACDKISLNGIKIKQKEYLTEGKYPVVDQGQELVGGYYNDKAFVVSREPPYIVFGDHTKVKKFINFKFIAGADGIKVLKSQEFCNPKLLFYFLHVIKLPDKGYARHFQFLEKSEFPLPPLPEQHRIVAKIEELFSELDKGVEALKTSQQQLKVYRQSVLKWAFEGKLTEEWRKQQKDLPTASQILEQIRTEREKAAKAIGRKLKPTAPLTDAELTELPTLPEEWCWVKVGDVTSDVEYGTSAKSKEKGKVVVVRMGNIQNCRIRWDDLQYTDSEEEIEKYRLKRNDVLFNRTNSPELVGKTAIYKGEIPAIFAGYLIRLNQLTVLVGADYINYFLNSHVAKRHGNSVKTDGVNQSNINGTKLAAYPFPCCSFAEQHQIVQEIESRLSVADKVEESIAESLKQAEALRQSILKKAFSGKLVPQDPNDEPADKLLARIRAERAAQTPLRSRRRPDSRPEALKRGPLV